MEYLKELFEEIDFTFFLLVAVFAGILYGAARYFSDLFNLPYGFLYATYAFWLPPLLAYIFWYIWVDYVRSNTIQKQKRSVLEILLPREISKSPLAMELALAGLHITSGESTWFDRYVLGKMRVWWSLEIASIEGVLHFYVWTISDFRPIVEAQLYGQYPGIEIREVPDYTLAAPYYNRDKIALWGNEFKLQEPDPYPIKTYVDFGLEKDPKEEFKVDPLTSVLEFMAGIGKGEQIWLQFVVRSHSKRHKHGTFFGRTDWKEEGKELIKKKLAELTQKPSVTGDGSFTFQRIPTKGEAEVLAAIDRNTAKIAFDVGARVVYWAQKDKFIGARIPAIINLMKPFNTANLNRFGGAAFVAFDYPWQDFRGIRSHKKRAKMLDHYRRRAFFHAPYKENNFVLSSEALATIYHFPGGVLQAPSVSRVLSKKAEPPGNLPR